MSNKIEKYYFLDLKFNDFRDGEEEDGLAQFNPAIFFDEEEDIYTTDKKFFDEYQSVLIKRAYLNQLSNELIYYDTDDEKNVRNMRRSYRRYDIFSEKTEDILDDFFKTFEIKYQDIDTLFKNTIAEEAEYEKTEGREELIQIEQKSLEEELEIELDKYYKCCMQQDIEIQDEKIEEISKKHEKRMKEIEKEINKKEVSRITDHEIEEIINHAKKSIS